MSEAVSSTGILLFIGNGASPEVFTDEVPELTTITPPASFRNPLETSTHNDGEESHVLGIRRSDTISGRVNWLVANPIHQQMEADFNAAGSGTKRNYRIVYPDGTKVTFGARVERWAPVEATVDSVKAIDFALRKDGPLVWAYV